MAVYKFRITFEEYDDISRDIEIKSTQTFLDFHHIILQSIAFDSKHGASFFSSDDYWRKNAEITLLEADVEPGVKLMGTTKISSFIEQPNQRFIYIYDIEVRWTFMIELIKLVPDDAKATYPRCVKTVGHPPKQYKQQLIKELKQKEEAAAILGIDVIDDELEPSAKLIEDEKLLFDEDESKNADLHDDENATSDDDSEEHEEGEEHEEEGGHDDAHGDERW